MSPCCQFGGTIICTDIDWPGPKGGGKRMAAKTVSKATLKKPKGKIGKAVKKK